MTLMKKFLFFCLFYASFAQSFYNNVSQVSSLTSIMQFGKNNNSYDSKEASNGKDYKNYRSLKITIKMLALKNTKNVSSKDDNDVKILVGHFITEILTNTLEEEAIFLLYDNEVLSHFTWFETLLYQNLKNKPHIAQEIQEFEIRNYDSGIVSGYKYITICIIYNYLILLDLFLNKTIDYKWAPGKLFVIFLDHQTTISEDVFNSSIQRSKNLLIAELTVKNKKYVIQMYSIYPLQRNTTSFSKWKIFAGIYNSSRKMNEILVERNKNFEGGVLHLASICNCPPQIYLDTSGNCIGANIDVLHIISKVLNFTFEIQLNTEDGFNAGYENNTFSGMLKDIHDNGKHVIINFLLISYEEKQYFDFSYPYLFEGVGFLCRIPEPSPAWKKIFLPFSLTLWILVPITISALVTVTFLIMKFDFRSQKQFELSASFLLVSVS